MTEQELRRAELAALAWYASSTPWLRMSSPQRRQPVRTRIGVDYPPTLTMWRSAWRHPSWAWHSLVHFTAWQPAYHVSGCACGRTWDWGRSR